MVSTSCIKAQPISGSHFSPGDKLQQLILFTQYHIVRAASKAELFTHVKLGMCVRRNERSQRPKFAPRTGLWFFCHSKGIQIILMVIG